MDIVLKSLFDEFTRDYCYEASKETEAFEKFVNYCVLSSIQSSETIDRNEIEEASVGGSNDLGLDGIGFFVNGRIVNSADEIDDLILTNNFLNVIIFLIQSKTSETFNSAEIGTFCHGVQDLFSEISDINAVHPKRSDEITKKIDLIKHIYNNSSKMIDQGLPIVKLYYTALGKWTDSNVDAKSRMDYAVDALKKLGLFSQISYSFWDNEKVKESYKKTKSKVSVSIQFSNKITLPEIKNVKESYLGVIKYNEYKKMIVDENGTMKNVFYDNIRAFQGMNNVNRRIDATLKDKQFDLFVLLNNGVTVIAQQITPAGNKFTLKDYQIVNGCQTSHILILNKNLPGIDDMEIPIRIISTESEDIKKKVTYATNSQTEVKQEQLISLLEYQKRLETFYLSIKGPGQLFYERLSRQYSTDLTVPKYKIITIPIQITSFISMFMEEPHQVRGYYAKIIESFEQDGKVIFSDTHKCDPYYTSALAYTKLEYFFAFNELDRQFKPVKYFLLLAFKYLSVEGKHIKFFNENYVESYCSVINKKLLDHDVCLSLFKQACHAIRKGLHRDNIYDNDRFNKTLSEYIIKTLKK